ATLAARDRTLDEQDAGLGVDLVDGQVLRGDAVLAHPAGHAHALEDPARGGAATDRARTAVHGLGAVTGALAGEAVALHDTRVALALGGAGDVDDGAVGEHVHAHFLADLEGRGVGDPQLDQVPARGDPGLGVVAGDGLVDLARVDGAERQLHGLVAVPLCGAHLGHHARPRLDDGHRDDPVVLVEDLGHAELVAQDAFDLGVSHLLEFSAASTRTLAESLDVDVDAGRQVDAHQRVDRLRRRVEDVQQPLVGAHLEVLARVLVLVRRADDAVDVLLGGQRHRPDDAGAGTGHRLDDLAR